MPARKSWAEVADNLEQENRELKAEVGRSRLREDRLRLAVHVLCSCGERGQKKSEEMCAVCRVWHRVWRRRRN